MPQLTEQQTAAANARHAAKLAKRLDDPTKLEHYPANRSHAAISNHVDARYKAKLEARIAAFSAGKPAAKPTAEATEAKSAVDAPLPAGEKTAGDGKQKAKGESGKG
jgi:hypothetical protein